MAGSCIPLGGPGHGVVEGDERRRNVEDLCAEPTPGVEDGVVEGTSKRVLSVGAEGVGDDAFLLGAACISDSLASCSPLWTFARSCSSVSYLPSNSP